jgi:predicted nucleic acid-binding protein
VDPTGAGRPAGPKVSPKGGFRRLTIVHELSKCWRDFYVLAKRQSLSVAEAFIQRLPSLPIHVVVPDENSIMAAARIKARHAVAYGDSFAIALAQAEGASVITGDREIRDCGPVAVDWVGSGPQ